MAYISISFLFSFFFLGVRALALNCNVPVNDKNGAESKNWKQGKPVRVVRNCKGRKHSKYCPEEGNRYDGIYKVRGEGPERGGLTVKFEHRFNCFILCVFPLHLPICSGGEVLARQRQVRLLGVALPAEAGR